MANKALPNFQEAGRFATLIGVHTAEAWERYCAGKSRQDLFEQVLSVINQRVIQVAMEA